MDISNYFIGSSCIIGAAAFLILLSLIVVLRKRLKMLINIPFFNSEDEYVLIIGLSKMAIRIAEDSRVHGKKVVFISEKDRSTFTDNLVAKGVKVIYVNNINERTLTQAGINSATSCLVVSNDDDYNINVANFVSDIKKKKGSKIEMNLIVHVENWYSRNLLVDQISNFSTTKNLNIRFFDFHHNSAKLVYDNYPPHEYLNDETDSNDRKLICVIGRSKTAESFILENAILSHFKDSQRLKILIFSKDASAWVEALNQKFPFLKDYLNLDPIELLNNSFSGYQQWGAKFKENVPRIDAAYFFGEEDAEVVSTALHFKQFIYNQLKNIRLIPLFVVLPDKTSIFKLLEKGSNQNTSIVEKYKNDLMIHFVREVNDSCTYEQLISQNHIEVQAKAINYFYSIKYEFDWLLGQHFKKNSNVALIQDLESKFLKFKVKKGKPTAQLEAFVIESLSSYTKNSKFRVKQYFGIEESWSRVTERNKESNRYIARHLPVKRSILTELNIDEVSKDELLKNISILAPIEHNRWSAEKLIAGFSFGELPQNDAGLKSIVKNTLKIHDQLDRFDNLSHLNQEKDIDLFEIIPLLENIKKSI